ncbi:MAG TPA: AcvB/VirJ family lysyl-phosphatidylglycerol hydrolase [Steroidobacteraceae bacterium]|nr:AcvB/VirJ family lysyl-phosphatidylglycerol hydrolase [Steroidobacteraceae bacterium]
MGDTRGSDSQRVAKLRLKSMLLAAALVGAAGAQTPGAAQTSGAPTPGATPSVGASPTAPAKAQRLNHGRFHDIPVYVPIGAPTSFALLLSGDEGWTPAAEAIALKLAQRGAMVAGIDWRRFKTSIEADGGQCAYPDGDLENLSHFVQAYFHSGTYLAPLLVGISSGASMSYAMLAQAPRNTFAAALTLGFCPSLDLEKPLCQASGPEFTRRTRARAVDLLPVKNLGNPWLDLQGGLGEVCPADTVRQFLSQVRGAALVTLPNVSQDFASPAAWMPQFAAAYQKLASQNPTRVPPPPATLSDLPVVEVPAQAGSSSTDSFALIMSGDGGWAGLDQDVAAALSAQGIPVVGLDSLRYFWSARTPEGLAADTDRLIRYYLAHFGKQRALLIGYSQGADVLPFAVNRLPQATRDHVALTAVMGMSEHALFEFHLTSWVSDSDSGPATLPEISRIAGVPVLCIYGADETDSVCPKLDPTKFLTVKLKGGHHFDGDYANLARQILAAAKSAPPPAASRSTP